MLSHRITIPKIFSATVTLIYMTCPFSSAIGQAAAIGNETACTESRTIACRNRVIRCQNAACDDLPFYDLDRYSMCQNNCFQSYALCLKQLDCQR